MFDHIDKQRKRIRKLPANAAWAAGFLSTTKACQQMFQKYYSKTEKQSLIYNLAMILDPSKKLALYEDWGNVKVQDPAMNHENADCIPFLEYYKYVSIQGTHKHYYRGDSVTPGASVTWSKMKL